MKKAFLLPRGLSHTDNQPVIFTVLHDTPDGDDTLHCSELEGGSADNFSHILL